MSTQQAAKPSIADILSKPTWSVRSLTDSSETETITEKQLNHLLRLSALSVDSKTDRESMLATLQSQLSFVRAVQRVDTTGVEPLRAIRDETGHALRESSVTLEKMKPILDEEVKVGHYQRPKRVKKKVESEAENWDALSTATVKEGRFFVVKSKKQPQE